LKNLRPPGSKVRKIPQGYGFDWVSCPNYFFESLAWFCIMVMTHTFACMVFWIISTLQMYLWAIKKHRSYIKEFTKYPRNRKAMFPFLA
jgi:very-long-chain enoyl-CoA reductase